MALLRQSQLRCQQRRCRQSARYASARYQEVKRGCYAKRRCHVAQRVALSMRGARAYLRQRATAACVAVFRRAAPYACRCLWRSAVLSRLPSFMLRQHVEAYVVAMGVCALFAGMRASSRQMLAGGGGSVVVQCGRCVNVCVVAGMGSAAEVAEG